MDSRAGTPAAASLTPETRLFLHNLIRKYGEFPSNQLLEVEEKTDAVSSGDAADPESQNIVPLDEGERSQPPKTIEISMRSDAKFFRILSGQLSGLSSLQDQEQADLTKTIVLLGRDISFLTKPTHRLAKTDLYTWREIFR